MLSIRHGRSLEKVNPDLAGGEEMIPSKRGSENHSCAAASCGRAERPSRLAARRNPVKRGGWMAAHPRRWQR
jgi:hypothetical protein